MQPQNPENLAGCFCRENDLIILKAGRRQKETMHEILRTNDLIAIILKKPGWEYHLREFWIDGKETISIF